MRHIRFFGRWLQVFLLGGVLYGLIELLWRGYTHWSMVLTGGIVLLLLLHVHRTVGQAPLLLRCLIGATLITAIELTVGCAVNLLLGLAVWDYSDRSLDLLGQICPLYSFYWFLLCVPIYGLCPFFDRMLAPSRSS